MVDIWTRFVTRVEAEIGKSNCISWLLSDNGGVYKSGVMTAFCASKGIQQRYSAAYGQWLNHTAERNMRTIGEPVSHVDTARLSINNTMLLSKMSCVLPMAVDSQLFTTKQETSIPAISARCIPCMKMSW